MPEKHNWRRAISRRQAIALTGAAGVGAFAGCLGGDDDDDSGNGNGGNGNGGNGNGGNGNGNGDDIDDLFGPELEERVDDVDYNENYESDYNEVVPGNDENPFDGEYVFNPYTAAWNPGDVQESSFEYLAVFHAEDGFIPRIADNWDHDQSSGVTTVTIKDNFGWSDGLPITAQDFVTQYKLAIYMDEPISTFVAPDGVRVVDDYTFEIEAREEYADLEQDLWFNQWIEAVLSINDDDFGYFVEQFEDADESEYESIQQQVVDYEPEWQHARYSGPFVWVDANEEYADRVPNPEHPLTDDWEFYLRTGQYVEEEGMRVEEVDFVHQQPNLEDLPSIYEEAPVSFSGQSFGILFGNDDDYIATDPTVRQALTYVVDMPAIVEETAPGGTPVDQYQTGLDAGYVEQFVHGDVLDAMNHYAEPDTSTATSLLEDAGFTLDGDSWQTPDGDTWQLEFPVGDWFGTPSEMISDDLQEFGIEVDLTIDAMDVWNSENQGGNYGLSVHLNYGQARQYHAHADLEEELFGSTRGAVTEVGLFEEEVEVPEVGNPDGGMVTINLREEIDAIAVATSEEEMMDHASNVAWAHNYLLPGATIHPWSEHYWVNTGEWNFDTDSSDWVTTNRIWHYILENGLEPL